MRVLGLSLGLGALLLGCSARSVDQPATAVVTASTSATAQPVQAAPPVSAAAAGSASAAASSAPVAVVAAPPPSVSAPVAEPVTAGPPHSRQDYLYRTARLRAQVRPPQVQRPADLPGQKADTATAPMSGPPMTLGAPKRLLYSGPSDKAPKELLTRPDVYCELSPGGNVRFFGP